MNINRKRIDLLLVEKGLVESRQKAQALVMSGQVLVNDRLMDKPGTAVPVDASVSLKGDGLAFVSRGGTKLEAALDGFHLSVEGLRCMDVGASTGGFTDCLLKRGAAHVTAVDVGYGQLAWSLRQDPRVRVLERTNIRHVTPADVGAPFDLAVIDVSFISLKLVVPVVAGLLTADGRMVCLVKPQFEVGKGLVGKGGVVKNPLLHDAVIRELTVFFEEQGFGVSEAIASPITGPKGNREFLILLTFSRL